MVKFKAIGDGRLPERADYGSAGFDCYTAKPITIAAGNTALVPLGIKLDQDSMLSEIALNYFLGLYIRSSLALKGLRLGNGVGVIVLSYPDEIQVIIENTTDKDYGIPQGYRICQLILQPHAGSIMGLATLSEDRTGGFGSTGV